MNREALQAGGRDEFLEALQVFAGHLESGPLTWGDPEYHPQKAGSTVLHGTHRSLFVQYVVYEPKRRVVVLKIKWLRPPSAE